MREVSLSDMLNAREKRLEAQNHLLDTYKNTLICLTLNIPGPVKVLPGVPVIYSEACRRIEETLDEHLILINHLETVREHTGYEAYFSVDTTAEFAKELMIRLEDADPVGRLFDIDVLREDGSKVSREELGFEARRCLLCGEPAHACSRSRRHSVKELTEAIRRIMLDFSPEVIDLYVSDLCEYALMAEVSATPKPGLVDLHDSGAHKDMDYDTFAASTKAIVPWLTRMFATGRTCTERDGRGLFQQIRPLGIWAEKDMMRATKRVNTHKGMIFSMGLVAAAAGLYYRDHGCFQAEAILRLAGELCYEELEKDFYKFDHNHPRTHGELLYARFRIKGIRGEAQQGFPSIRTISYPALMENLKTCPDENSAFLNTLLALMAKVDDTNVLIRTNQNMLNYEKSCAARLLSVGGAASEQGMEALRHLNEEFIKRNISPGGCADLLAVTLFLWKLELLQ